MNRTGDTAYPLKPERFKEALNNPKYPPVFMFTMGKVASKSIGRSLEGSYPGAIIHAHAIAYQGECPSGQVGPGHPDPRFRLFWEHIKADRPVKIICPVRESLSRNVSDFFHNFHNYVPFNKSPLAFPVEHLVPLFYAYQPHFRHAYWFDIHFNRLTGINVYEQKPRSSNVHADGQFQTLVFRVEEPDHYKVEVLTRFLQIKHLKLKQHNVASSKPYGDHYRSFATRFEPTKGYRLALDQTHYARHFYPRGWEQRRFDPQI